MIEVKIQEKSKNEKRNHMIGMYEFSLENIYQQKDHALLHQWVAIIDTSPLSNKKREITGYIKLSIQVTGDNDEILEITEDSNDIAKKAVKMLIPT